MLLDPAHAVDWPFHFCPHTWSLNSSIGCFSCKTRTSLKRSYFLMFLKHSNFPAFSLPESCSQTDKFPKNALHSSISIICECAHIAFCFPSCSTSCFLQFGLQKNTFQVVSCRIERTVSLPRRAKVLKLISLCNLHFQTIALCWRLLDSRLLPKTA